jgi:hypothetical protein
MLGDGIVSFGVAVVTISFSAMNASPKMVLSSDTLSTTFNAAASNSRSPSAFVKCTVSFSSAAASIPPSW